MASYGLTDSLSQTNAYWTGFHKCVGHFPPLLTLLLLIWLSATPDQYPVPSLSIYDRPVTDLSVLEWTALFLYNLPGWDLGLDTNPQFAADVHPVRRDFDDDLISIKCQLLVF
jgi:hypothetical protein